MYKIVVYTKETMWTSIGGRRLRKHTLPEKRKHECHLGAPAFAARLVGRPRWVHLGVWGVLDWQRL